MRSTHSQKVQSHDVTIFATVPTISGSESEADDQFLITSPLECEHPVALEGTEIKKQQPTASSSDNSGSQGPGTRQLKCATMP